MDSKYEVTIGLEVHCEVKTNSKMFSASPNNYNENANENITEVDMAFPGILPVANPMMDPKKISYSEIKKQYHLSDERDIVWVKFAKGKGNQAGHVGVVAQSNDINFDLPPSADAYKEAVRKAIMMSIALNCKQPKYMYFDRKNYYYPDLPKGYQITQNTEPVGVDGYINVFVGDEEKRIDIHDIHLEEDTASLDHYDTYSLIDYNRCSVPLLETVTEPCIHSADEALAFLDALRRIFLYTNISDARTDRGQMRCDVNISLAPVGSDKLGTKVEMKNINSFSNVKDAIIYEIKRQSEALDNGEAIVMETRRYDDSTGKTYRMREKVEGVDYKYYVEPNIPPIKITDELIKELKDKLPMLQYDRIKKYMSEYDLSLYDASILTKNIETALYFEDVISKGVDPKIAANWINTRILGYVNKEEININDCTFKTDDLVELIEYINKGTISTKQAKDVFYKCLEENKKPSIIIKENNMEQITDTSEILNVILEVIEENKTLALEYDPNRGRTVDFFVGQVMKKTRGKANPKAAMDLIKEELMKLKK